MKRELQFRLNQAAADFMLSESEAKYPNETGGILIGLVDGDISTVRYAVGPGPAAIHSPNLFVRDGLYAQAELDAVFINTHGEYDYMGEWHSHPRFAGPSLRDRASLAWISTNPSYHRTQPILVICMRTAKKQWKFCAYQWKRSRLSRLNLVVVDD